MRGTVSDFWLIGKKKMVKISTGSKIPVFPLGFVLLIGHISAARYSFYKPDWEIFFRKAKAATILLSLEPRKVYQRFGMALDLMKFED